MYKLISVVHVLNNVQVNWYAIVNKLIDLAYFLIMYKLIGMVHVLLVGEFPLAKTHVQKMNTLHVHCMQV